MTKPGPLKLQAIKRFWASKPSGKLQWLKENSTNEQYMKTKLQNLHASDN